jgi:hypothetical protein
MPGSLEWTIITDGNQHTMGIIGDTFPVYACGRPAIVKTIAKIKAIIMYLRCDTFLKSASIYIAFLSFTSLMI